MHGLQELFSGKVGVASWTWGGAALPAILGLNVLFLQRPNFIFSSSRISRRKEGKGGGETTSTVTGSHSALGLPDASCFLWSKWLFRGKRAYSWGFV